jgi:hypothetical protein
MTWTCGGTPVRVQRKSLFGALVLTTVCWVTDSHAESSATDRETARMLMDEGDGLVTNRDYRAALKVYLAADALVGAPTTGFAVANTYELSGQLVEAHDRYLGVARSLPAANDPPPFIQARRTAKEHALDLEPRIPSFRIVFGADALTEETRVEVDGLRIPNASAAVSRRANPGHHSLVVRKPSFAIFVHEFDLQEGERRVVDVGLQAEQVGVASQAGSPAAPVPPVALSPLGPARPLRVESNYPRWGSYSLIGAGAFAAIGSVTGIFALREASRVARACDSERRCPASAEPALDAAKVLGVVSTVSFGLAVVGGGIGLAALLTKTPVDTQRASRVRPRLGLGLGPGWLSVRGVF